MTNYYEAINRYNNHNYSCNLLSTLLGRHQVNHYILTVSVNSLQKFYKVGSIASSTFQIRKLWLREAKQVAQGHIYAMVHFKVMLVGVPTDHSTAYAYLLEGGCFGLYLKTGVGVYLGF